MYSRPSSNKAGCLKALVFAGAIVVLVVMYNKSTTSSVDVAPEPTSTAEPRSAGNPIYNFVAGSAQPTTEGVAIALVIDTSGSMEEPVSTGQGKTSSKMQIARQCASSFVQQCETFAKAHPDKKVLLGIYQFSHIDESTPALRTVFTLGSPDASDSSEQIQSMQASGGTPIGDAMIQAYQNLASSQLTRKHILVITDGENNRGYQPGDVAEAMGRLEPERRPSIYFVAFDTAAAVFKPVASAGGLVMSASDGPGLQATLEYLLSGKILAEQPDILPAKSQHAQP